MLQTMIDASQATVNGWVRLKLYKGNVIVAGRDSKTDSLFDPTIATFEDDAGAYDQKDAAGFMANTRNHRSGGRAPTCARRSTVI